MAQAHQPGIFISSGQQGRIGGMVLTNLGSGEVLVQSAPGSTTKGVRTDPSQEWGSPRKRVSLEGAKMIQLQTVPHGQAPIESTFWIKRLPQGLHVVFTG